MKIEHKSFTAEFNAGTYFIGDPCYVLREDLYEKWGKEYNYADGGYGYFAVGSTAYGDGVYEDVLSEKGYAVDAGILGVVNMDYSQQNPEQDKVFTLNELGKIVVIKDKLIFKYDHNEHIFYYDCDGEEIEIHTETAQEEDEEKTEYEL